jgi:phosphoserine phosphatase
MMLTFRRFITEQTRGKGLTIFDIDETLFQTKALVKVMKDGKVVRTLDNQEYNTYKLKDGESYDYGEFRSAEVFQNTSVPISKMIQKAKAIIRNATEAGSRVIIVTARADFDNKKKFLDTFRKHGIDIDKVYVERAGNLNLGSSAKNKRFIFHKYLRGGKYERVRFFDDAMSNINMFKAMAKKYPGVSLEAYHVNHDGSVRKI